MPHLSYRDPTEAELAWQVFHALAFGARGISYFTYWTPLDVRARERNELPLRTDRGRQADPALLPGRAHQPDARRARRRARRVSNPGASSIRRAQSRPAFPTVPFERIDGGPVTAGVFVGPQAELAFLLVNRDYRFGVDAELRLQPGADEPLIFDTKTTRRGTALNGPIALEPGGARLVRFRAMSNA